LEAEGARGGGPAGALSISRQLTPRRANSAARVSPVGPAPTIKTSISRVASIGRSSVVCPSRAELRLSCCVLPRDGSPTARQKASVKVPITNSRSGGVDPSRRLSQPRVAACATIGPTKSWSSSGSGSGRQRPAAISPSSQRPTLPIRRGT
jgi:hypothetical protein